MFKHTFQHILNEAEWRRSNAESQMTRHTEKLEKLKAFDADYPHKFYIGEIPTLDGWKEWTRANVGYGKNKRYGIKEGFICFSDENDAFAFRMRWT